MSLRQTVENWLTNLGHGEHAESDADKDAVVCARIFAHRYEADVAKTVLEGYGIPCFVAAQDNGGASPNLVEVTGGARLWLRRDQMEQALQVLDRADLDSQDQPVVLGT